MVNNQRDEFQTEVVRKQDMELELSQKNNQIELFMGEVVRKLDHLQQKQDQLASKQDLLHC